LPQPALPQTSVGLPCGSPPPVISSSPSMPVEHFFKPIMDGFFVFFCLGIKSSFCLMKIWIPHPPIKDSEGGQVRNDNIIHALFIEFIPRNSASHTKAANFPLNAPILIFSGGPVDFEGCF
jgi:hypothetical protein